MAIAVRSLCEFSARKGSLDTRYTPAPSAEEGREAHAILQARRLGDYRAEHPLKGSFEGLEIRGRADGYRPKISRTPAELEEIKSHRGKVSKISPQRQALHWAQLKVYGALHCQTTHHKKVRLSLVYFDIDSDKEHRISQVFAADELILFTRELCVIYQQWQQKENIHRVQRDEYLSQLKFCFPSFRQGQRELAETCYKSIATAKHTLLEAPTGLGKTLGIAFPHLKAIAAQKLDNVLFLSNRNTGKTLWMEGLQQLGITREAPLRVLQLDAKQNACDHPDLACHGESCPLAEGFFDRLSKAREEAANVRFLSPQACAEVAKKHHICRYFLAQEMARWSDVVIADVNHYCDQQALLFGLSQQNQWRTSIAIDEAHNTIERARGMYSVCLEEYAFNQYKKQVPKPLKGALNHLLTAFRDCAKHLPNKGGTYFRDELPTTLIGQSQAFASKVAEYMVDHPGDAVLQELMFKCFGFARLAEHFADHSLCQICVDKPFRDRTWRVEVSILNIDPAPFLAPKLAAAHSVCLFSATLSPFHYYQDLLGLKDCSGIQLPSPFSSEQIELHYIDDIDTRLPARQESAPRIAARIEHNFNQKPGNYLVFFPSFTYLNLVADCLAVDIPLIKQHSRMDETDRLAFLNTFKHQRGVIGFAVMGGIFGEGIDLPGDQLIGVSIVSLGLPPFDDFHQQLAQRLQRRYGQGYEYTYLYPAIRKIVQAAGRLIRHQGDSGTIELIDQRFKKLEIKQLFPAWWFEKNQSAE